MMVVSINTIPNTMDDRILLSASGWRAMASIALLMTMHMATAPMVAGINTARAAVIDQRDFVEAITSGRIAGAALDVFWQEPLPANHPLLTMRNVLITPHMAGLTVDVDKWSGKMMAEDVLHYLNGEQRRYIWKR